jgi:hypothetical protein
MSLPFCHHQMVNVLAVSRVGVFDDSLPRHVEARGNLALCARTQPLPLRSLGSGHEGVIMSCATLHVAKLPDLIRRTFAAETAVKTILTTRLIAATGALRA